MENTQGRGNVPLILARYRMDQELKPFGSVKAVVCKCESIATSHHLVLLKSPKRHQGFAVFMFFSKELNGAEQTATCVTETHSSWFWVITRLG